MILPPVTGTLHIFVPCPMDPDTTVHNRQTVIVSKICSLFLSLDSSTYDEVAPKVEFWIKYALAEHSTTVDELVDRRWHGVLGRVREVMERDNI